MKTLPLILMLAACGPVWDGTWTGPSNFDEACDGFAPTSDNITTTWTISDVTGTLSIVSGGQCGALTATVSGTTASMEKKLCPVLLDGQGDTMQRAIESGTLRLAGDRLNASIQGVGLLTLASGAQSNCVHTQTSALSRVQ